MFTIGTGIVRGRLSRSTVMQKLHRIFLHLICLPIDHYHVYNLYIITYLLFYCYNVLSYPFTTGRVSASSLVTITLILSAITTAMLQ